MAAAKLVAAWVPAVVIGIVVAVVYSVVANLVVAGEVDGLVLPTGEFTVMVLWVGLTFAAAALAAVSLVSVRSSSTQEAFQVGGLVVLPVVGLLISQATGVLLLSVWLLLVAGLVASAIAVALVLAVARVLSRPRLLRAWGEPHLRARYGREGGGAVAAATLDPPRHGSVPCGSGPWSRTPSGVLRNVFRAAIPATGDLEDRDARE